MIDLLRAVPWFVITAFAASAITAAMALPWAGEQLR